MYMNAAVDFSGHWWFLLCSEISELTEGSGGKNLRLVACFLNGSTMLVNSATMAFASSFDTCHVALLSTGRGMIICSISTVRWIMPLFFDESFKSILQAGELSHPCFQVCSKNNFVSSNKCFEKKPNSHRAPYLWWETTCGNPASIVTDKTSPTQIKSQSETQNPWLLARLVTLNSLAYSRCLVKKS